MKTINKILKQIKALYIFISGLYIVAGTFALYPFIIDLTRKAPINADPENILDRIGVNIAQFAVDIAPLWFIFTGVIIGGYIAYKAVKTGGIFNIPGNETKNGNLRL